MYEFFQAFLTTFSLTETDAKMIGCGLVFFVILYKYLQYRVFGPILDHIEQREAATSGATDTASGLRQKATALQARYEDELFKARVEGNATKMQLISAAKAEASKIATQTESEIAAAIKEGREAISRQMQIARTKAEQDSTAIAEMLAQKVDTELLVH